MAGIADAFLAFLFPVSIEVVVAGMLSTIGKIV